jgi:HJR/Mrr/RecB family endonuclease
LSTINGLLAAKGLAPLTIQNIESGPDQLKALVDLCHVFGIAVAFDVVYNHAGGFTVTPRIEALRAMTPPAFRAVVALMLERFGHAIITDPTAPDLVTSRDGRKFVTACARPADPAPTATREIARLHDAVIAANAQRGFFITARRFTAEAEQHAESAPVDLIDARLIKALNQSRKGVLLPQTYKLALIARSAPRWIVAGPGDHGRYDEPIDEFETLGRDVRRPFR